jgi:hypothetical protein
MARARGGDSVARRRGGAKGRENRPRKVHIFAEGAVTELEYIDIILADGIPRDADQRVEHHFENATVATKYRKPLPMVESAVRTLRKVEREAKDSGLKKGKDWNWPQVWVLFDRDDHPNIKEAMDRADEVGVRWAYSHPCFELWRLLHYTNYTSSFGGVCGDANSRLRQRNGFAGTYGVRVRTVSEEQSKHVKPGQVLRDDENDRYASAKKYALKINGESKAGHPNTWDPYTNVWRFVEEGLLLSGY